LLVEPSLRISVMPVAEMPRPVFHKACHLSSCMILERLAVKSRDRRRDDACTIFGGNPRHGVGGHCA